MGRPQELHNAFCLASRPLLSMGLHPSSRWDCTPPLGGTAPLLSVGLHPSSRWDCTPPLDGTAPLLSMGLHPSSRWDCTPPLGGTAPRDSYAWNCKELATLLTLSESLAKSGFQPLTIGSITRRNLTIEQSQHLRLHGATVVNVEIRILSYAPIIGLVIQSHSHKAVLRSNFVWCRFTCMILRIPRLTTTFKWLPSGRGS